MNDVNEVDLFYLALSLLGGYALFRAAIALTNWIDARSMKRRK